MIDRVESVASGPTSIYFTQGAPDDERAVARIAQELERMDVAKAEGRLNDTTTMGARIRVDGIIRRSVHNGTYVELDVDLPPAPGVGSSVCARCLSLVIVFRVSCFRSGRPGLARAAKLRAQSLRAWCWWSTTRSRGRATCGPRARLVPRSAHSG